MTRAMTMRPGHEGAAGELRPIVGTHRTGVAAKDRRAIEQPGDVLAADAEVHRDIRALVAEVVGHAQALQAPAIGQAVADKVLAPDLVDAARQV